jgi:RNA polymerase sigma-70 factor, ECF subfamily
MFRLALALLRSRALAEDVVQDTWLAVVDGLASFQGRSSLKTWIFRILFNRALTYLRDEARSVPVSELRDGDSAEVELDPESWRGDDPEKLLVRKNAIVGIEGVLQLLPPRQRAVVTLGLVDGLKSDEVCGILGVRESHRRVLLHRARSKLRRALQDHLTGAQMQAHCE